MACDEMCIRVMDEYSVAVPQRSVYLYEVLEPIFTTLSAYQERNRNYRPKHL